MTDQTKPKRPWSVTLLALGVLSLTSVFMGRLVFSLVQWDRLVETEMAAPAFYLPLTGLVWGAVGLPLIYGLWRGLPWASAATRIAAVGFTTYYWIDRTFLSTNQLRQTNQRFAMGATLAVLVLILWILSTSKARTFFGEKNDRSSQSQDSTTA